ncbi:hypothetical protein J7L49_04220, partial [Candidatus Bathyarchaeota archaeon]|nr:hypothetical protein [Candidatus Bathyarchaeota archaeon]
LRGFSLVQLMMILMRTVDPENFKEILLKAVDEGLSSLGNSPKQAILFHLENSFNLKKDEIPINPREFDNALKKIFGPGVSYLEKLILKRLYEKIGLKFKEIKNWSFVDYLENVKNLREDAESER